MKTKWNFKSYTRQSVTKRFAYLCVSSYQRKHTLYQQMITIVLLSNWKAGFEHNTVPVLFVSTNSLLEQ